MRIKFLNRAPSSRGPTEENGSALLRKGPGSEARSCRLTTSGQQQHSSRRSRHMEGLQLPTRAFAESLDGQNLMGEEGGGVKNLSC